MFIGASAGSTAGGMKVIRLIIVLKFVYNEITQACTRTRCCRCAWARRWCRAM